MLYSDSYAIHMLCLINLIDMAVSGKYGLWVNVQSLLLLSPDVKHLQNKKEVWMPQAKEFKTAATWMTVNLNQLI